MSKKHWINLLRQHGTSQNFNIISRHVQDSFVQVEICMIPTTIQFVLVRLYYTGCNCTNFLSSYRRENPPNLGFSFIIFYAKTQKKTDIIKRICTRKGAIISCKISRLFALIILVFRVCVTVPRWSKIEKEQINCCVILHTCNCLMLNQNEKGKTETSNQYTLY